jgi:long-chain acyl-CoA synthetase
MTERIWLREYPEGVPADIEPSAYGSLVELIEESFDKYAERTAYRFMGQGVSYAETDQQSRALAAYLQGLGLAKGDRVALMMPNVPQYPAAVAAVLRAGWWWSTSTRCTPRASWSTSSRTRAPRPSSSSRTSPPRWRSASPRRPCNTWCWPPWATGWAAQGRHRQLRGAQGQEDGARLQPARRRALQRRRGPGRAQFQQARHRARRHRRAAVHRRHHRREQGRGAAAPQPDRQRAAVRGLERPGDEEHPGGQQSTSVCALPLYHIFAFTVNMMLSMRTGGMLILIPNPRDLPSVLKELSKETFHSFPAVNTLFNGLATTPTSAPWTGGT